MSNLKFPLQLTEGSIIFHFVASNIFTSSGSPVSCPSIVVRVWQVAIHWTILSSTPSSGTSQGRTGVVNFWLPDALMGTVRVTGTTEYKSSPSSVNVPVLSKATTSIYEKTGITSFRRDHFARPLRHHLFHCRTFSAQIVSAPIRCSLTVHLYRVRALG